MKRSNRTIALSVISAALVASYTLGVQGNTITLTPANPSILAGQTLQLTPNGAVMPAAIAVGAWHTCVLYSDQSIRCTGLNNQGEIGNNNYISVSEPVLAQGTVNPVALLTGSNEHTCTFVGDGRMQCWGTNYTGQLGDGTMGGFAMVPQFVHNISTAIKGVTGGFHTCAILPDHTVQCWGRNQDGQLGNGDATTDVPLPAPVIGLGPVEDLVGGGYHNCALMAGHSVSCWGRNARGQIGDGTDITPVTQPHVVSGLTAAALSLGGYHSCALMPNATVQCWGENDFGQVGAPGLALSKVPLEVSGLSNVVALNSGFRHNCATLADGSVRCWGQNTSGQLGDGTTNSSATPVVVQGIVGPRQVDGGWGHTCALMPDTSVWCWGDNTYGQLGNGTNNGISPAPVLVHGTGVTWTSSDPSIATVSSTGVVTGVRRGTTTITVADPFGNTGSVTVDVKDMLTLAVIRQGDGGGTVTSAPAGVNCPAACSGTFVSDSQVTLTAAAASDSLFAGWTGCDSVSGATCTVTMTNARTVNAMFTLRRFTLSVTKTGTGNGTVASNPAGINCGTACASDFVINTTVTLTAAPGAGSVFSGWTGCDSVSGATCTVTMANARSVNAIFTLQRFTLTATKTGAGNGTVTSSPAGINCGAACASDFVINTTVTLTAAPGAGSIFSGWTGCDSVSGATCTVTVTNARSVNAIFTLQRFTLTVTKTGIGKGTVTSSPAGINCGTACASDYVINTTVTLTATPNLGSLFLGWTGCDAVNGNACTVQVTAAKAVSANFLGLPLF